MISYHEAVTQLARVQDIVEFDGTALGIYSHVSDPDHIVLYIPGGTKPLGLLTGTTVQPNGFTWRWMPHWLEKGVALATVDMPQEYYENGMSPDLRQKSSRMNTVGEMVKYLRQRFPTARIGGYGHSYGSLEMSVLVTQNLLDSVVIGSGNWNPDPDSKAEHADIYVKSLDVKKLKCPLLIVHHVNDATSKCNYQAAKKYMELVDSITVYGGVPHLGLPGLDPGPHFFHGQESEIVKNIVLWLRNKTYSTIVL